MDYTNVEGIILAGGFSTRAGTNKLLLEIKGKTIIERCILSMYDTCSRIIVVGGHRIEDIRPLVSRYSRAKLIFNSDYKNGMFSSVKKGLSEITREQFFITPGDYPMVRGNTYKKMLEADKDLVIPVFKGRNGHPLLMKRHYIKEILSDNSLKSLRNFIGSVCPYRLQVEDEGVILDVDHMEDYYKLTSKAE